MGHSSLSLIKEFSYKFKGKKYNPVNIKLSKHVPKILKKSLKLRVVDVGDDEGTMAELYSLEGSRYSIESYGIDFVASPKHADGIIIVGAITQNMLSPLIRAYNIIPEPKVVIAIGDKAINGDSRFVGCVGRLDKYLKVDLEIPGNPPSPEVILSYLISFLNK